MTNEMSSERIIYQYNNPDGSRYCEVSRIDKPDGKEFVTLPSGLEGPHPLYRAERLAALPPEARIVIVEGEKAVHCAESAGLIAVTSKGGSCATHKTDWAPLAPFTNICILPDNDEPGTKYAQEIIRILNGLSGSRRVTICDLPGLGETGDIVDFMRHHTVEELMQAIEEHGRPAKMMELSTTVEGQWPEPKPLLSVLRVVPTVLPEMLPDSIRNWCFDAADRMQAPVDFMAVAAVTLLGSLIGRQLTIRPKAWDSWSVKPNIWSCLVGQPSMMKSPCLKEARRFVDKMDREAIAEYVDAFKRYEREYKSYTVLSEVQEKKAKQAKSDYEREQILDGLPNPPEVPIRARNYTQDATVEKLQELLKVNPRGILLFRDELVGFLRALDKPGQEGSRAFYLEGWEGNGRFLVDRIGRGSSVIEGVCMSVLGCATPGGLQDYVQEALGNGEGADGLLQRFSLVPFPDTVQDFQYVDRRPDEEAAEQAETAFRRCNNIDIDAIAALSYPDSLPFLRFDSEAQCLFEEWYTELVRRCRREDEHPALQAHLMKFSKLVPALSLIFHVADGGSGPVPATQFIRAAAWADYGEEHARRLYDSASHDSAVNGAKVLLEHIRKGELPDGFTVRDVYLRKAWAGLSDRQSALQSLTELAETGHLRPVVDRKGQGGRPTVRYLIHPKHKESGNG